MEKFKLFIVALFTIIILSVTSGCTKKTIIQTDGSPVIVEMNLSSGVNVGKNTRADGDFMADIPTSYKAFFVAAENTDVYKKGSIIKTCDVSFGDNLISLPDIKYNIYITNYNPSVPSDEAGIKSLLSSIPQSSTTLYLTKEDDNVIFHSNKQISETLVNNYAAVCIAANQFVTGAQYNTPASTNEGTEVYKLNGNWYYLYIRADNDKAMTNTTVWIKNIPYNTGSYQLAESIKPNYIYQYTLTDNTSTGLKIIVAPFAGTITKIIDTNF